MEPKPERSRDIGSDADLGRMIKEVRYLEHEVYRLARAVGVWDPESKTVSAACREAARQIRLGLPPWASDEVATQDYLAWFSASKAIFARRNPFVHWTLVFNGGGDVYLEDPRSTNRSRPDFKTTLVDLAAVAKTHRLAGARLTRSVLLEVLPGAYWLHPILRRPGDKESLMVFLEYSVPESRPTADDVDEWRARWRAELSLEHASWPAARYGVPLNFINEDGSDPSEEAARDAIVLLTEESDLVQLVWDLARIANQPRKNKSAADTSTAPAS